MILGFVIRRHSDGKYKKPYNNGWTEEVKKAKIFRNKTACHNSMLYDRPRITYDLYGIDISNIDLILI